MRWFRIVVASACIAPAALALSPWTPGLNPAGASLRVEDPPEYRGRKTEGLTPEIVEQILERKREAGAPPLADLDVIYCERTPRFPRYWVSYDNGRNPSLEGDEAARQRWPDPGETVTFWAHVANKGLVPSKPASYRFLIDGLTIGEGTLPAIEPCDQAVVTATWPWQAGRHALTVQVDLDSTNNEITEANNTLCDFTDAYTFFWTIRDLVYIEQETRPNNYGSYSTEDWHRSVMDWMNDALSRCVWPLAPDGIPARVRLEYVWLSPQPWVDHDAHPLNRFCDGGWPHYPGGRVSLETATDEEKEGLFKEIQRTWEANHFYNPDCPGQDRALQHELSHQLGLIDVYHMNVPAGLCQVTLDDGRLLRDALPEKAFKRSWVKGLMIGGLIPQVWSEHSAAALVRDYGKRRGFFGEYLLDLPERTLVRIVGSDGNPIPGAAVRVYQRDGEAVPDTAVHEGVTDSNGLFDLGARPFGTVHVVGVNGSLLFRVDHPDADTTDWVWLDVVDINLAHWRNPNPTCTLDLPTALP